MIRKILESVPELVDTHSCGYFRERWQRWYLQ